MVYKSESGDSSSSEIFRLSWVRRRRLIMRVEGRGKLGTTKTELEKHNILEPFILEGHRSTHLMAPKGITVS